jgi:biotin-dependent carboxylase-like uncharacterized protein
VIEIVAPGPLATIQDLGRPGLAHLGVGTSGAADRPSLRLANRLVGNEEAAACLELTLGGLAARAGVAVTIALTGAECAVDIGGRQGAMFAPLSVAAGERIEIGLPARGLRTYLAVRGGIAVPAVLGSRSTDLLAGLGPAALRRGDMLPVGRETRHFPDVDLAPVAPIAEDAVIGVVPGPRDDWFVPGALDLLGSAPYEVTPASNRVGLRLSGPALARAGTRELPPEGMVAGALQVPPNGQPVLFLADHPVTGGYPVIAVCRDSDLPRAAQLRPGRQVRFRLP